MTYLLGIYSIYSRCAIDYLYFYHKDGIIKWSWIHLYFLNKVYYEKQFLYLTKNALRFKEIKHIWSKRGQIPITFYLTLFILFEGLFLFGGLSQKCSEGLGVIVGLSDQWYSARALKPSDTWKPVVAENLTAIL